MGPFKGLIEPIRDFVAWFAVRFRILCDGFLASSWGSGGFSEPRNLVGTNSTYPGTSPTPWRRIVSKNPEDCLVTVYRSYVGFHRVYVADFIRFYMVS